MSHPKLGDEPQMEGATELSAKPEGKYWLFKIPSKYLLWAIVAFSVGYNPARDLIAGYLPQRGSEKRDNAVARADGDNTKILASLTRIEALNSELATLNASVVSLNATCKELKDDIRTLNGRVDDLYRPKP